MLICTLHSCSILYRALSFYHVFFNTTHLPVSSFPVIRKYIREGGDDLLVADDTRFPTHKMSDGVRIIGRVVEVTLRKLL